MTERINLEYLQIAKNLTGSSDIDYLIEAARKIEKYFRAEEETVQPPTFLDFARSAIIPGLLEDGTYGWVPFEPYRHQLDMIDWANEHPRTMFLTARQIGASTVLAAYAVYEAITKPGSEIGFFEFRLYDALELLERCRTSFMEKSTFPMPKVKEMTKRCIVFENGSRILARTADQCSTIGLQFSHIIISNAAFIPRERGMKFWEAILPSVACGARTIVQSCAGTSDSMMHGLLEQRERFGFQTLTQTWNVMPDAEAWVERMRGTIDEESFARQFEVRFPDDEKS